MKDWRSPYRAAWRDRTWPACTPPGFTTRLASELCRKIVLRLGVSPDSIVLGTVNAGHPGATIPLAPEGAASLHPRRLPANLYVSDASLLPRSLGNPPMLTVMGLSKAIARRIKEAAA